MNEDVPEGPYEPEAAGARRGRRRLAVAAAALGAAALVAVPVGIQALDREGGTDAAPAPGVDPPDPAGSPAGWRVESWRDVTLRVPPDWGHGDLQTWCAQTSTGRLPVPRVDRPGGIVPAIACLNPASGYGVELEAAERADRRGDEEVRRVTARDGEAWPAGAWVGRRVVGGTLVSVTATDAETARRVLGSARTVAERDPNGCAPHESGADPAGDGDRLSVCRYDHEGWLAESVLLGPADSAALLEAVAEAPPRRARPSCPADHAEADAEVGRLLVGDADRTLTVVLESRCPGRNGVTGAGAPRRVTRAMLPHLLTPGWSGSPGAGVPPIPAG